jgi:hypothetical protein
MSLALVLVISGFLYTCIMCLWPQSLLFVSSLHDSTKKIFFDFLSIQISHHTPKLGTSPPIVIANQ